MKICAALDSVSDIENIDIADIVEIKTDLFEKIPTNLNKQLLVTFKKEIDLSIIPENFKGIVDIGENKKPDTDLKVMSSYHYFDNPPVWKNTENILKNMEGDIVKIAMNACSFEDLHDISCICSTLKRPHVIIGMDEMGIITRLRSELLKNEFTFGYVSAPTASGQLEINQMKNLEDCMITGIIGYPLSKSLSPVLHNFAFKNLNINGIYLKFESEKLKNVKDVLVNYNVRGVNITQPYKQEIINYIDDCSNDVSEIGAVNTIINDNGKIIGQNTDIIGIDKALSSVNFCPTGKRALILGSGGAARACAYYLVKNNCAVTIVGRNPVTSERICKDMGCESLTKNSANAQNYDLIINCTPIGMYNEEEYPINICNITKDQTIVDLAYGKTSPIVSMGKFVGSKIVTGEEILLYQGAASFESWTGIYPYDIMRDSLK